LYAGPPTEFVDEDPDARIVLSLGPSSIGAVRDED
jgi:hypothetical protein